MNKRLLALILGLSLMSVGCSNNTEKKPEVKPPVKSNTSETDVTPVYSTAFGIKDNIYFILTDRFNDGDTSINTPDVNKSNPLSYHGGDLRGVIDKLDYIKDIGSTAIWITPVAKNEPGGYHGYWINDFYSVDPHLGDMETLKELVSESHKRGMKVILDHVVNHTGYKSPWLSDPEKSSWFHESLEITNWNDQTQVENGWLAGLPDLDQSNPEVEKYLLDNTLWWIEETGVDGMRLDTVKHVSPDFWQKFSSTIKEKHPNFYLIGEVWSENPRYLEKYHKLGLDGVTDYSLYKGIREAFTRFGKSNSLVSAIKSSKYLSNKELNGIFIDNHDNSRLITSAGEHGEAYLKQALTFIMTYPSIPITYYGTELALEGGNDPDNRRDMPWSNVEGNKMLEYYKFLTTLKSTTAALQSSDMQLLSYDDRFISYMRGDSSDNVIIIMNLLNREKTVSIENKGSILKYKDTLTDDEYNFVDEKLNITLNPLEIKILIKK